MNSYNYGMAATRRKLQGARSNRRKYSSRLFLNLFKLFFVVVLFLALAGAGIGAGVIDRKSTRLNSSH